jgi:hypothetical protein
VSSSESLKPERTCSRNLSKELSSSSLICTCPCLDNETADLEQILQGEEPFGNYAGGEMEANFGETSRCSHIQSPLTEKCLGGHSHP